MPSLRWQRARCTLVSWMHMLGRGVDTGRGNEYARIADYVYIMLYITIHMRGCGCLPYCGNRWGSGMGSRWTTDWPPPTLNTRGNTANTCDDQNQNESTATRSTAPGTSIAKNVSGLQATFSLPPHSTTLLGVKRSLETGMAYITLNEYPIPE